MKAIKILEANEALFIKASEIIGVTVIKLTKIRIPGYAFYRVVAPFSQQEIFYLGVVFGRLIDQLCRLTDLEK